MVVKFKDKEPQELTLEEIIKLKTILIQERDILLNKSKERLNDGSYQISRDDLSDDGDKAAAETDQEVGLTLAENERNKLSLIERALKKIDLDDGSYGLCEGTGDPIGCRRLEIQPWVLYSLRYQEEIEKSRRA